MTTTSELELPPDVSAAIGRELNRVCPGWTGAVLTVYLPGAATPVQLDFSPAASRHDRLPSPAV